MAAMRRQTRWTPPSCRQPRDCGIRPKGGARHPAAGCGCAVLQRPQVHGGPLLRARAPDAFAKEAPRGNRRCSRVLTAQADGALDDAGGGRSAARQRRPGFPRLRVLAVAGRGSRYSEANLLGELSACRRSAGPCGPSRHGRERDHRTTAVGRAANRHGNQRLTAEAVGGDWVPARQRAAAGCGRAGCADRRGPAGRRMARTTVFSRIAPSRSW